MLEKDKIIYDQTRNKIRILAPPGFEPGSAAPKAAMIGRYTRGLTVKYRLINF